MSERFGFGKNWQDYIRDLDESRIGRAEQSLRDMTGLESFAGKTFLDIGCGSGLLSLAARRLGAKVTSFDYDPDSVAAAKGLKEKFFPDDNAWQIARGDVLDPQYMAGLGVFDIVYSWGVLHHTGNMHKAFGHAAAAVNSNGLLFIAIYNDEGRYSRMWLAIKKLYNLLPNDHLKKAMVIFIAVLLEARLAAGRVLSLKDPLPRWKERNTQSLRGMSVWHDYVDWVGGLPFEVAKSDEIFRLFRERGFELENMTTVGRGHGCNEFVFRRKSEAASLLRTGT
ncbi:MAG TPA: class I SAM-dependent methyltransferase [Alphaproteobacteria bacterium]